MKKILLSLLAAVATFGIASTAFAMTPTLTISREGSGSDVRITVWGDANGYIDELAFRAANSTSWSTRVTGLGRLDNSGYFTTVFNPGYDYSTNLEAYVTVGGQQSAVQSLNSGGGCYGWNCGNYGSLSLSQTNVSLNVGQTATVNVSSPYSGNAYVASNSNSSAVYAWTSGSTLYLRGDSAGSANVQVCAGNSGSCGTVYVNVSGSGSQGNITFSQSTVSLSQNQSTNVTIYNSGYTSGSYYISNNSNSSVVSASVSGNTLYLSAQNTSGNSTVTVCQYGGNCGSVYVTVSGYGSGSGSFWLSQNNVTVNQGQSVTVNAYFSGTMSGNLYLSNNSNSNVASATFSGSTVSVYGNNSGSTTLTICHSGTSSCQSLNVTVQGNSNGGNLYFTTTSLPQMYQGQYYSTYLQVAGGSSPYTFTVVSGSLPQGLSLSSSGQLFGTPQNSNSTSFSVRATDYYGRTATQNFNTQSYCQNGYGTGCVLGGSTYRSGQLIAEGQTVYIVYKNTKIGFASREVFETLGFRFSEVLTTGYTGLIDSGYVVTNANASHPWGSWIKSGQTVYFVHESGLIPVPNYFVFQNNGGEDRLVVPANTWDFQRPILPVMTENDYRLR